MGWPLWTLCLSLCTAGTLRMDALWTMLAAALSVSVFDGTTSPVDTHTGAVRRLLEVDLGNQTLPPAPTPADVLTFTSPSLAFHTRSPLASPSVSLPSPASPSPPTDGTGRVSCMQQGRRLSSRKTRRSRALDVVSSTCADGMSDEEDQHRWRFTGLAPLIVGCVVVAIIIAALVACLVLAAKRDSSGARIARLRKDWGELFGTSGANVVSV